jgi:hypothetical protein
MAGRCRAQDQDEAAKKGIGHRTGAGRRESAQVRKSIVPQRRAL